MNSSCTCKPYPDYIDLFAPKGSPLRNTSKRYYPLRDRIQSEAAPRTVHHTCFAPPPKQEEKTEVKNENEELTKNKVDSDSKNAKQEPKINTISVTVKEKSQQEVPPEAPILNDADSRVKQHRPKSMKLMLFLLLIN